MYIYVCLLYYVPHRIHTFSHHTFIHRNVNINFAVRSRARECVCDAVRTMDDQIAANILCTPRAYVRVHAQRRRPTRVYSNDGARIFWKV